MTKKTRKVGITGKYGTRYGSALRKIIKKFEVSQHARYLCPFCGKEAVRRNAIGIWNCSGCGISVAGGAWELTTNSATTAKSNMARIKKLKEEAQAELAQEKTQKKTTQETKEVLPEQRERKGGKREGGKKEGGAKGGKPQDRKPKTGGKK